MTTLAPPPTETPPTARHGRDLVDPDLFARLAGRVAKDHPEIAKDAERLVDQALAYLGACAVTDDLRLVPAKAVDHAWHTFILHTREYAQFCSKVAGRFIHHVPDDPASPILTPARATIGATVATIRAAGFTVHGDLWTSSADCREGACSQCYQGCADDPRGA